VKLAVWSKSADLQAGDADAFNHLISQLQQPQITPTACLADLPPEVAGKMKDPSWTKLLTADRSLRQPQLAYLIARHADHLTRWQLGADGSDMFVTDPDMRKVYKTVYREFANLIDSPDLAMPWPAWYELDGEMPATVALTVITMAIAVPCGMLVAALRLYGIAPVRSLATAYVELFRNLPLILVVYWAFYVLPILTGLGLSALATGLAALSLNVTAYNAETFRAGINSIRRGQVEAALALGMSRTQALRRIVVPQALRRVLPVLASTWVSLFKDTSLVSVIAVTELAYVSMQVRAQTFRVLEMLTAMAVIYWLLGYPQAKLVDWIQRRYAVTE
jgi:polar amino acid transport system permease protein